MLSKKSSPEEERFNPFPNNKLLKRTKLKAFEDGKLSVTQMTSSPFDKVKNILGKGENAGYQLVTAFSKAFILTHYHTIPHFDAQ